MKNPLSKLTFFSPYHAYNPNMFSFPLVLHKEIFQNQRVELTPPAVTPLGSSKAWRGHLSLIFRESFYCACGTIISNKHFCDLNFIAQLPFCFDHSVVHFMYQGLNKERSRYFLSRIAPRERFLFFHFCSTLAQISCSVFHNFA